MALAASLFFFITGLAFIPNVGVENDETIFAMAFLKPFGGEYIIHIGHSRIPLMIMTYIGTLKAWLYRPILRIFGTGIFPVRVPMLLAGVVSLWLFFLLLRRIAGERAAIIGCSLLAADATYLLTTIYDWGPVAMQHLLLLAGMFALVRFYQGHSQKALFWGFFLLGLALWDKALAVWMLSAMTVSALVFFAKPIFALATKRRIAIAVLGFFLGSLPLLVYNKRNHWITFRGNIHRDTSDLPGKARMLMNTANGSGLFGWIFFENWQTKEPHPPADVPQRISARISSLAGHPRQHLLFYGFLLALLLAPLARGDALRLIGFGVLTLALAWIQMAINANTGGSVHHTILLWPLPQLVIAVSFAAASRRLPRLAGLVTLGVVGLAMVISGVLVTAEYHYVSYRYGGAAAWTDAIFDLTSYLKSVKTGNIYCVDWGTIDSLRLLSNGTLPVLVGDDPINKPALVGDDRLVVERMIADPGAVFVAHTKEFENFAGVNQKLVKFAEESGYSRQMMKVLADHYGRPAYEVYTFAKL